MKKLREVETVIEHGEFLGSLCKFIYAQTIVEVGVQFGNTTRKLAEAARETGGTVFGYDQFSPDGIPVYAKNAACSVGVKGRAVENLKGLEKHYKLTTINSHSDDFLNTLKKDTKGKIDFAFIDADHSYLGCREDFKKIYPLLSEDGIIAFHDTYSHSGLRKFAVDLSKRTQVNGENGSSGMNDGTFGIINLPFGGGNKRHGLTLLGKKSHPNTNSGISVTFHDPEIDPNEVYKLENLWYESQITTKAKK